MALTADDFIYPVGQLQTAHFPGEHLDVLVEAWLTQAIAKVAGLSSDIQDIAASHWVYYRAYDAIANRIAGLPNRTSFGGNSGGGVESTVDWGQNRSDYWAKKAAAELEKFEYYVPPQTPVTPAWSVGYLNLDYLEPDTHG